MTSGTSSSCSLHVRNQHVVLLASFVCDIMCQALCLYCVFNMLSMPSVMQFFKGYDRLLTSYMRHGEGIGLDLTVVSLSLVAHDTKRVCSFVMHTSLAMALHVTQYRRSTLHLL